MEIQEMKIFIVSTYGLNSFTDVLAIHINVTLAYKYIQKLTPADVGRSGDFDIILQESQTGQPLWPIAKLIASWDVEVHEDTLTLTERKSNMGDTL